MRFVSKLIVFFLFFSVLVFSHEMVHVQINSYHGCDDYVVGVNWYSVYVEYDSGCYADDDSFFWAGVAHNVNDLLFYPFSVVVALLMLIFAKLDELISVMED